MKIPREVEGEKAYFFQRRLQKEIGILFKKNDSSKSPKSFIWWEINTKCYHLILINFSSSYFQLLFLVGLAQCSEQELTTKSNV